MGANTLWRGSSRLPRAQAPLCSPALPQPPHRQDPPACVFPLATQRSLELISDFRQLWLRAPAVPPARSCRQAELASVVSALLQEGQPGPSPPPGSHWTPRSLALLTDAGGSRLSVSTWTGLQGASVLRHEVLDFGLRPSALGHVKRRPPFPGPLFLGYSSLNVALQQSLLGLRLKYEFHWKPWKVGLLFGSLTHPKLLEWCLT